MVKTSVATPPIKLEPAKALAVLRDATRLEVYAVEPEGRVRFYLDDDMPMIWAISRIITAVRTINAMVKETR